MTIETIFLPYSFLPLPPRETQVGSSFSGLINTVPGLNLDLLKMDTYKMDMEKDHLFRGEFDVVKQLLAEREEMASAKNQVEITAYVPL